MIKNYDHFCALLRLHHHQAIKCNLFFYFVALRKSRLLFSISVDSNRELCSSVHSKYKNRNNSRVAEWKMNFYIKKNYCKMASLSRENEKIRRVKSSHQSLIAFPDFIFLFFREFSVTLKSLKNRFIKCREAFECILFCIYLVWGHVSYSWKCIPYS